MQTARWAWCKPHSYFSIHSAAKIVDRGWLLIDRTAY
jgi:hypothetical protein